MSEKTKSAWVQEYMMKNHVRLSIMVGRATDRTVKMVPLLGEIPWVVEAMAVMPIAKNPTIKDAVLDKIWELIEETLEARHSEGKHIEVRCSPIYVIATEDVEPEVAVGIMQEIAWIDEVDEAMKESKTQKQEGGPVGHA